MGNAAHSTEIITPHPDQPADFTLDFKRRAANHGCIFLPIPPRCHLCFTWKMEGLFINSSLIPSAWSHQIWPRVPSWELQSPKTCPGSPRGEALWVETFPLLAPNHPAGVGLQQSHQGVRQGKAKPAIPASPDWFVLIFFPANCTRSQDSLVSRGSAAGSCSLSPSHPRVYSPSWQAGKLAWLQPSLCLEHEPCTTLPRHHFPPLPPPLAAPSQAVPSCPTSPCSPGKAGSGTENDV